MPENNFLHPHKLSNSEIHIVLEEVKKLLYKGIIVPTTKVSVYFISAVFNQIKKDNAYRMILNLKLLNKFICYNHFKMECFGECDLFIGVLRESSIIHLS